MLTLRRGLYFYLVAKALREPQNRRKLCPTLFLVSNLAAGTGPINMNTNEYLARLKQIDCLISLRSTGTPEQCACKLNISKRTLFNYINELKNMDMPVTYCRELQSYIYTREGGFEAGFKVLTEMNKV